MNTIKINGIELEFDTLDFEFSEKVENALEKVSKRANDGTQSTRQSEVIRHMCNIVFDFFDEVWGDGTHKRVFGNRMHLVECMKAFETVTEHFKNLQNSELEGFVSKYSPNRAQRRQRSKNNKGNRRECSHR